MSIATTEFAERCFPDEDRSCSLQPSRYKAVAVRYEVPEQQRTKRRRHAFDIGLVFHDQWNSVERSDRSRLLKCGVQPLRFVQHVRVERDNRIDGWTGFIVRRDAIEVHLHQLLGGEGPAPVSCVNVFDRRFHDLKTFLAFCSNVGGPHRHGYDSRCYSDWYSALDHTTCHGSTRQPMRPRCVIALRSMG